MILLTGGTGFLGRYILKKLSSKGKKVRLLCRNPKKIDLKAFPGAECVEGDLMDQYSLHAAFEGVTEVIHAAALISFLPGKRDDLFRVNVGGTAEIVDACLEFNIRKLIHISSIGALGMNPMALGSDDKPISESSKWKSSDSGTFYGRTKYLAELEVYRGVQEGLNAVILNPSVILGAGDWHNGTPALFRKIAKGLSFYPTGKTGWVAASDVAEVVNLMLEKEIDQVQKYLLSSENLSYQEVIGMICNSIGKKPPGMKAARVPALIVGKMNDILSGFSKKSQDFTYENAKSAFQEYEFDGSKICKDTGFSYRPIREVIEETGRAFLKDSVK